MKTNHKKLTTPNDSGVDAESRHLADFTTQRQFDNSASLRRLWAVFVTQRFAFETSLGQKVSIIDDHPEYFIPVFAHYEKAVAWAKKQGYDQNVVVELSTDPIK